MKNLFVNYEIALKLKQLGFDEGCIAYYHNRNEPYFCEHLDRSRFVINSTSEKIFYDSDCTAPLYQQVIDWFREEHNISVGVTTIFENSCIGSSKISSFLPHCNVDHYDEECDDYYKCLNFAILKAINIIENEKTIC